MDSSCMATTTPWLFFFYNIRHCLLEFLDLIVRGPVCMSSCRNLLEIAPASQYVAYVYEIVFYSGFLLDVFLHLPARPYRLHACVLSDLLQVCLARLSRPAGARNVSQPVKSHFQVALMPLVAPRGWTFPGILQNPLWLFHLR